MRIATLLAAALFAASATASAQQVTKETIPGISTFARVETTIACGGATSAAALPAIKKMGFVSVINVRDKSETGANIDEEAAAAQALGMNFVHIPFVLTDPHPEVVVDRFIAEVTKPQNTPAYIHCAAGGRAASLWMVKRVLADHWDDARALEEANALGLNDRFRPFALNYIHSHQH